MIKGPTQGSEKPPNKLVWEAFSKSKVSPKGASFRFFRFGLGRLDLKTGKFVQEFWRERSSLHINVKELEAAVATVRSLAKPREKVLLSVDNSVAFSYLTKGGGKKKHLNAILRPFVKWCL